MTELPPDFIHEAPKGFRYRTAEFKSNVISIWCDHLNEYSYNSGAPVSTIWGFYNTKKRQYFAPINSKKVGAVVDINSTLPLTAMKVNRRGLELLWM
jgi:hypothetical protein